MSWNAALNHFAFTNAPSQNQNPPTPTFLHCTPHSLTNQSINAAFLEELRAYSMRLHTKEQAKEGQASAPKEQKPVRVFLCIVVVFVFNACISSSFPLSYSFAVDAYERGVFTLLN